jgi:hypothetical protein
MKQKNVCSKIIILIAFSVYNGQMKKEIIQWPKEKGDNTMAK